MSGKDTNAEEASETRHNFMAIARDQLRRIIAKNDIQNVGDIYSLFKDGFKDMLQELLEAEMDASLGYTKHHKEGTETDNKRNGYSTKTIKSQYGEFPIDMPRNRNGAFEPQIIPKHQRGISGIEEKIISLYARGLSTRDIHDQQQDLYSIEVSADMVCEHRANRLV